MIEIRLDPAGRPQRYDLWFRGWSGRGGFWFDDNSLYRQAKNGRLVWAVQPAVSRPLLHPWVENVFAGRRQELAELHRLLLDAGGNRRAVAVCSVQGMGGIGKSYLVDRFYQEQMAEFPGGYLRLVLDPR